MCAIESLDKDFKILEEEDSTTGKWSTRIGDCFSGLGAYAEILRYNAAVTIPEQSEEELRQFLFDNPIDYECGRGRLSGKWVPKITREAVEKVEATTEPFDECEKHHEVVEEKVVNVASVDMDEEGKITVRSWKDPRISMLVSKPFMVNMKIRKRVCRTLIDLGCGLAGMMDKSFAEEAGIKTSNLKEDIHLRYADDARATATDITAKVDCNVQLKSFKQHFVISPKPLPGVDAILGLRFFQENEGGLNWEGSKHDQAVFTFPDGCKWREESNPLHADGNAVDMCHIGAQEAAEFLRKIDQKEMTDVFVISVTQALIDKGVMASNKSEKRPLPKIIQDILDKNKDLLVSLVPTDLPDARGTDGSAHMSIPLIDGSIPVKLRPYNMSNAELRVLQELLKDLVEKGYIERCTNRSSWAAPIMLIRKGGNREGVTNQWRIVTDYRELNKRTKASRYTPPNIRAVLDHLVNMKVFSKTDMVGGFYQMGLKPDDRDKTTFVCKTPEGHTEFYRFKVACLGLAGCPSAYQEWLEDVMKDCKGTEVYLDDMIHATKDLESHAALLRQVFEQCRKHKIFLHPGKCEWAVEQVDFLGMTIGHNRISID